MAFKRILTAFDESELALKSLTQAIQLADGHPETEIYALHVVTLPRNQAITPYLFEQFEASIYKYGEEVLKKAHGKLDALPNKTEAYIAEGAPIRVILEEAERLDCDLIVMGSRGLSGFKEFLGSVSHYIVQHSHIPVLLVK